MTHFSDHDLWTLGDNRVATMTPSPDDLFVVTTVSGRRVSIEGIGQYDKAVQVAEGYARRIRGERPVTIKVLPMSLEELLAHMGMTREEFAAGMQGDDAADRQLIIDTCRAALRESNEPGVRAEALALLERMGAIRAD